MQIVCATRKRNEIPQDEYYILQNLLPTFELLNIKEVSIMSCHVIYIFLLYIKETKLGLQV